MAADIWNYIAGYVIINIEGTYLERLVNDMIKNDIEIWDVSRVRGGLQLSVGIGGFYRLRTVLRRYPCRVRIAEKHGLTVALCHMGPRYVMPFGWAAALFAVLIASRSVWIIDVEGCGYVKEADIRRTLEDMGVTPGTGRGKLDTAAIAEGVKASDGRIAWAGAQLTGVVLQISVKEARENVRVYAEGEPCSIYASESGVITSITALSGKPCFNVGDAVKKGELLINGSLGGGLSTEARGSVTAEVMHRFFFHADRPKGENSTTAAGEELKAAALAGAERLAAAGIPKDAAIISKKAAYESDDAGMTCVLYIVAEQNICIIGDVAVDE